MDTFIEHIVARHPSAKDYLLRVLIVLGALVLIVVFIFFSSLFGLGTIGMLLAVGVAYGAYYLFSSRRVEYEYIVTNGEIDIDKITAKRKRKRLVTVSAKTFEAFGPYAEDVKIDNGVTTIEATDNTGLNVYYATFRHPSLGNALLLFSPDERVLSAVTPYLPRTIKH